MKSAVLKADWFDPEINPKLADFCRHYGMHVVQCRPGMPHHKGKRPLTRQPRRQETPFADIHDNQRYMVSDIVSTRPTLHCYFHKMLHIKHLSDWRMGRDSNPRYLTVHTLSRRAQSTALAPIRERLRH
jgi:hypothetical protein